MARLRFPGAGRLRTGYHFAERTGRSVVGAASFLASYRRTRADDLRERWTGERGLGAATRVAVFVHDDPRGRVAEFVHHYLAEIERSGFAIVFVSNAPCLVPDALERLRSRCALILRRDNVGRDFGAYRDALAALPSLDHLDALLLANDSVYGPFHDLQGLLDRMDLAEADVWGATDGWQRRFHLQSYFVLFGRRALASEAFRRFWARLRYVQAKSWVIDRYEIGLTRTLMDEGLRCRAAFPYREIATSLLHAIGENGALAQGDHTTPIRRRFVGTLIDGIERGLPLNSLHFFRDHLIVEMRCPFLERELLRDNPVRIPGLISWKQAVQSVSRYDTGLIERHLEETMRNRAL